jgi:hypothetical protein
VGDYDGGRDAFIVAKEEKSRGANGGYGCDEERAMEKGAAGFGKHAGYLFV